MPIDTRDWYRGEHPPTCACVYCVQNRLQLQQEQELLDEERARKPWRFASAKLVSPSHRKRSQSYLPRKATTVLGWATFTTAIVGFVASLWLCTPILANLYLWSISTTICICLAFIGWGLAHYDITNIWNYYFKPAFILLLELGCIATIIYASYSLITKAGILPFEGNIALFTVASIILACLGWITRHKVITTLLTIPFIVGITMVILQAQGIQLQLPEALKVLLTLWYVELYFYLMFAPFYILAGIALIVFIIWLAIAIFRDITG